MKKVILLSVIFLVSASTVFSQKIQLGVVTGINYSLFSVQKDTTQKNGIPVGYHFGITCSFRVSNRLTLSPELSSNTITYHFKDLIVKISVNEKTSFATLSVPLKYTVGKERRFFVYAGPSLQYVAKSQQKLHYQESGTENIHDVTKSFPRYSFSLLAGAGYRFTLSDRLNPSLYADYTQSLFHIDREDVLKTSNFKYMRIGAGLFYTLK